MINQAVKYLNKVEVSFYMYFYLAGNQPDQEVGGYQETGGNKEHGIKGGSKNGKNNIQGIWTYLQFFVDKREVDSVSLKFLYL